MYIIFIFYLNISVNCAMREERTYLSVSNICTAVDDVVCCSAVSLVEEYDVARELKSGKRKRKGKRKYSL